MDAEVSGWLNWIARGLVVAILWFLRELHGDYKKLKKEVEELRIANVKLQAELSSVKENIQGRLDSIDEKIDIKFEGLENLIGAFMNKKLT